MNRYQVSKLKTAFTLIEVVVFISIIGVLFLIGFPAFRAYKPSLELSGTVRELVSDIRYAEQLAVAEQVNHGILFFPAADKYQIVRGAIEEVLEEKTFPQEVSFKEVTFTNNKVIFNPYGAVEEAGIIILVNTRNSTTTLDVRPSGFVKIID